MGAAALAARRRRAVTKPERPGAPALDDDTVARQAHVGQHERALARGRRHAQAGSRIVARVAIAHYS